MLFILNTVERKRAALNMIWGLLGNPVMELEIREHKRNRSTSQNRLYWMWVNTIAKEIGNEADELHEVFKIRLLGVSVKTINGQEYAIPNSTTKLKVSEFTTFLQGVESFAASLNISLPIPDDYDQAMGREAA